MVGQWFGVVVGALAFLLATGLAGEAATPTKGEHLKEAPGERPVVEFPNEYGHGAIVIDTSERRLYYTVSDKQAVSYPIAVGRPSAQWYGTSYVSHKRKDPTWAPTASMRRRDPRLPKFVPPGPDNPLGIRAIYLGWTTYRIHGTNSPGSIGSPASSGCFRMFNEDVSDLYERVHIGAPVYVVR